MYRLKVLDFEGPVELLYQQVKEGNINPLEISFAEITQEFLEDEWDIEEASAFLLTMASLLKLKTRLLVPSEETVEEEEEITEEITRTEIHTGPIIMLMEKEIEWTEAKLPLLMDEAGDEIELDLYTLAKTYRKFWKQEINLEIDEKATVPFMMGQLESALNKKEVIPLIAEFIKPRPLEEGVVAFAASLELTRLSKATALQEAPFSEIYLRRRKLAQKTA